MPATRWIQKPAVRLALLALVLMLVLCMHLFYSRLYTVQEIVHELFTRGSGTRQNLYIWETRVPRTFSCVVVGAILGLAGSAFQAIFRNPLAEPYIVGVSSGSAVGGACAILLGVGADWQGWGYSMGTTALAFPAGLTSLALVMFLARRRGVVDIQTLLLAGVVTGAMLSALLSFLLLCAGMDSTQLLRWLLGDMSLAYWNRVDFMGLLLVAGSLVLLAYSKQINAFAMGEEMAQSLGVNVGRLKLVLLVTCTAMVASTVGAVGIIGFLGLVAPHLSRRLIAVDWRWSLVGAGLIGSILLLLSDHLAQHLIPEQLPPVGIITALVGAPFLLVVLRKERPNMS